ncbi:MAG TPA: right-handed parallel beta-helix repeat-containing protein [Polyangia bacterium]|nr:right-handed parallel beta-helix repeat-containing protein [Polyangia bacterium]
MNKPNGHVTGPHRLTTLAPLVAILAAGAAACNGAVETDDGTETTQAELRARVPNDEPPFADCIAAAAGTLTASTSTPRVGDSVTLIWNVTAGCSGLQLDVSGMAVGRQGTTTVWPYINVLYALNASIAGARRTLAFVAVVPQLADEITIHGSNWQTPFLAALQRPNTKINVDAGVDMDLSAVGDYGVEIQAGVSVLGNRSSTRPGPRFYTTRRPKVLFVIAGDSVTIRGVRIQGPDTEFETCIDTTGQTGFFVPPPCISNATGVYMEAAVNVLVENNEILGWSQAGIRVLDIQNRIDRLTNARSAVIIRGNYIHNNQRQNESDGYGVESSYGAYALIAQNVFERNRHDIESDGRPGSGYYAESNLVLADNGQTTWVGFEAHTHTFDVHGTDNCGPRLSNNIWNCGDGGEYYEIANNTFLYTEDQDVKVRGLPAVRVDVISNAFRHQYESDAIQSTMGGVYSAGNRLGMNVAPAYGACDFDGDGVTDTFWATGETWWFSSGGTGTWTYLNTSKLTLDEVTLSDANHDNTCDVLAGGFVYSGGKTPL